MKQKRIILILTALILITALSACAEPPRISTSIGEFELERVEFVEKYGEYTPAEGTDFLLVHLVPVVDSADLINKMQPYFAATETGAQRAKVYWGSETPIEILSVASAQSQPGGSVSHALVFEVPASWRGQKGICLMLPAPDNQAYEIK